jgi:hypothetical protein
MTELERIIAERDQLRAELGRAQIQFGTCSVCGYVAWRERNAKTEDCQYCAVQAELERVQAQNAAMREALSHCVVSAQLEKDYELFHEIEAALATDAGKDHIAKEKLKPIVEALETAKRYCFVREAIYADSKEVIEVRPKEQIDSALSIAHSLGIPATQPEPATKV